MSFRNSSISLGLYNSGEWFTRDKKDNCSFFVPHLGQALEVPGTARIIPTFIMQELSLGTLQGQTGAIKECFTWWLSWFSQGLAGAPEITELDGRRVGRARMHPHKTQDGGILIPSLMISLCVVMGMYTRFNIRSYNLERCFIIYMLEQLLLPNTSSKKSTL